MNPDELFFHRQLGSALSAPSAIPSPAHPAQANTRPHDPTPQSQQGRQHSRGKCPYGIPTCQGCSTSGVAASAHHQAADLRLRVQQQDQVVLRPPHQIWNDIRQSFVAWNYSVGVINAAKAGGYLKAWDLTRSVAVVGAADALSTLNIGMNAQDYRLLNEGRRRYHLTICALRDEMARPNAIHSDNILNSIFTVCHLEVYTVISAPDALGWQTHVGGVVSIFRKRGVNGFKTPPAQALLQNCRHLILMDALLRRKRTFLGDPRWIAAASQNPNTAVELMNIGVRVPEALEAADLALAPKKRSSKVLVGALTKLVGLQDELQKWLLKYYKQWSQSPYQLVRADSFPAHIQRCGELTRLFPQAYLFPSFVSATTHEYYWILLMLVRISLADIANASDERLLRAKDEEATLTAAVEESVGNLCQSVPFLSKPEHKSFGIMSTNVILHFAHSWFTRRGEKEKAAWCLRIKGALLQQGSFRMPLRLHAPMFIWWMLPENSVPTKPNQTLTAADDIRIIEESDDEARPKKPPAGKVAIRQVSRDKQRLQPAPVQGGPVQRHPQPKATALARGTQRQRQPRPLAVKGPKEKQPP